MSNNNHYQVSCGGQIVLANSVKIIDRTADTDNGYYTSNGGNRFLMFGITVKNMGWPGGLPCFFIGTNGDPCCFGDVSDPEGNPVAAAEWIAMLGDCYSGGTDTETETEETIRRTTEGVTMLRKAIAEYKENYSRITEDAIEELDWYLDFCRWAETGITELQEEVVVEN